MSKGFTLKIVKRFNRVTPWAIQAVMHGEARYRFYHYKRDAEAGMKEWEDYEPMFFEREFYHNFDTDGLSAGEKE